MKTYSLFFTILLCFFAVQSKGQSIDFQKDSTSLLQKNVKINTVSNRIVGGKVIRETLTEIEIQVNPKLIVVVMKSDIATLQTIAIPKPSFALSSKTYIDYVIKGEKFDAKDSYYHTRYNLTTFNANYGKMLMDIAYVYGKVELAGGNFKEAFPPKSKKNLSYPDATFFCGLRKNKAESLKP